MKNALLILTLLCGYAAQAQYQLYKESDSLQIYTKWSHVKWYNKKSGDVLLVKVVNRSSSTVEFSIGVEFFSDMKLAEESPVSNYCLEAGKILKPRVHGLVFQTTKGKKENDDSIEFKDFDIVKKGNDKCPKE